MLGCVHRSKHLIAGLALAVGFAAPVGAEPPRRVVSINLCTDHMALLLADPEQIVSLSNLASDTHSSVMAEEAAAYPMNHGLAEEVFLQKPDLVLAGQYTARATTSLLQRLDIPVAVFAPAYSLDDVRANLRAMGEALGQGPRAEAMIARFDADLAALRADPTPMETRPRAALYYANGYSSGKDTLAGQILEASGFRNATAEAGLTSGGFLPLEVLILENPDLIVRGARYPGASRSEEILAHPALRQLGGEVSREILADRDWICGTPHVLTVIAALRAARHELEAGK